MSVFAANQLQPWLDAIKNGYLAAAPAEGMYGYVANPFHAEALQNIYEAKQRSLGKGFIVLIRRKEDLSQLCAPLTAACTDAIKTFWQPDQPPTTLILPAHASLPSLLTGGLSTVAVRLPYTVYMQAYLNAAKTPLVSTSLNVSGQPPALSVEQIPANTAALTLPQTLAGTPSRIFNPLENTWLR